MVIGIETCSTITKAFPAMVMVKKTRRRVVSTNNDCELGDEGDNDRDHHDHDHDHDGENQEEGELDLHHRPDKWSPGPCPPSMDGHQYHC